MLVSRRGRVLVAALSLFGLAQLSFFLGSAVMLLHLPPWKLIGDSYIGIQSYLKRQEDLKQKFSSPNQDRDKIDKPDKTYDGFTLVSQAPDYPWIELLDMRQKVVHKWDVHYNRIWPTKPPHVHGLTDDVIVFSFFAHLFPNGDLLVNFHGNGNGVNNGYGLVKLDKKADVIWRFPGNVHHDLDVTEDGKTIFALEQQMINKPLKGLEYLSDPCMIDNLIRIDAETGKKTGEMPILQTLQKSPYAALLGKLEEPVINGVQRPPTIDADDRRRDVMHTNHVEILTAARAPKFPMFKAGQIMISSRHLDIIAVLDFDTKKMVWACRGPWHEQHDPEFLDNGHILLFDNQGMQGYFTRDVGINPTFGSRVLEIDPATLAVAWSFSAKKDAPFPLYTFERGDCQRLPNGNTLIVDTHGQQAFEVTPEKEVVWRYVSERDINYGRRYGPKELDFIVEKNIRPR